MADFWVGSVVFISPLVLKFLTAIGTKWNVTLFHYRNRAVADGWILMGIQAGKIK